MEYCLWANNYKYGDGVNIEVVSDNFSSQDLFLGVGSCHIENDINDFIFVCILFLITYCDILPW
jgi:hypothetical protein